MRASSSFYSVFLLYGLCKAAIASPSILATITRAPRDFVPISTNLALFSATDHALAFTATEDLGQYRKGDVSIHVPEDLARKVKGYIDQNQQPQNCKADKNQRRSDQFCLETVYQISLNIMKLARPGGDLAALTLGNKRPSLPDWKMGDLGAYLQKTLAAANVLDELKDYAPEVTEALGKVAFLMVSVVLLDDGDIAQLVDILMESSQYLEDPASEIESCPSDAPQGPEAPLCSDCNGVSSLCTSGQWKGCHCLRVLQQFVQPGDRSWLDEQQQFLNDISIFAEESGVAPACDHTNPHLDFDLNNWADQVKSFCTDFDPKKGKDVAHTYEGVNLQFGWEDYNKPNCTTQSDCSEIFEHFAFSGDCMQHGSIAPFGNLDLPCGKASFKTMTDSVKLGDPVCLIQRNQCNVQPQTVHDKAGKFCDEALVMHLESCGVNNYTSISDPVADGVNYNFVANWISGCTTDGTAVSIGERLGSKENCRDKMVELYSKCNNGGNGGYRDWGCMRLQFMPSCGVSGPPGLPAPVYNCPK